MTNRPRAALAASAVALSALAPAAGQGCADLGVPVEGRPTWTERGIHVLVNAARMAPTRYRDTYLSGAGAILSPTSYPPVPPLTWSDGLARAARAQSTDLCTTAGCPFSHNSCDGRTLAQRVAAYYPGATHLSENISSAQYGAQWCVNGWLLDRQGGVPAPDLSWQAAHRTNVMAAGAREIGAGVAVGGSFGSVWTADFAASAASPAPCSPLVAGAHIVTDGRLDFLANYYAQDSRAPLEATLVLEGQRLPMTPHVGPAARGTWRATAWLSGRCRSYHFEFRDADGRALRYPARGELRTGGDGECQESYLAGSGQGAACTADFDGSGDLRTGDLFSFFSAYFAASPAADFNRSGGTPTMDDLMAFLRAWFAGC